MKSSTSTPNQHGLKRLILYTVAIAILLTSAGSAYAASCIDLADIPLDAMEQAAPGMIMFVLDDSGSMDWSTMTPPQSGEDQGTFDGMEYVFSNPGDDVYGGREHIEDFDTHKMMWMSQWSGYNGMYYNPDTDYTPWPTLSDVDVDDPPSHPMNAGNTLDMTTLWHEWDTVGVVVDDSDAGFSVISGNWQPNGGGWNNTYFFSGDPVQVHEVQWVATGLDPALTYDVEARWLNGGEMRFSDVVYTITGATTDTTPAPGVDQRQSAGLWNTWVRISDAGIQPDATGTATVTLSRDAGQSNLSADAVQFVPQNNTLSDVARRHYYVQNTNGTFLVNLLNGVIEYYRITLTNPADNREVVTADKVARISDAEAAAAGIVTGRSYAEEIQNFANWYSYYRRRELTATNAIAKSISTMEGVYIGILSINGKLAERLRPVRVTLNNTLYDESSQLLTALYGLTITSQGTPLRNGLKQAGEYYRGNYLKPSTFISQRTSATYPFFKADQGGTCQQAFTILFTDGFYNGGDPGVGDADSNNDTNFDGPPFADGASNTLADVAMYYFENDLNTSLANDVPVSTVDPADHQHMVTFTIAFGVTGSLNTLLYKDCPNGACPDPWPGTGSNSGKIDDMFHAAINGRGQFIAANNNEELIAALEALGNDIDSRLGSAAALATNSIQRQVGSVIYQGIYNTANWYGDVRALGLNVTTGTVGTPYWQASDHVPAWDARNILSYDGSTGITFDAANLTTTQVNQLEASGLGTADEIVNYIRGDNTNTVANGGTLRDRHHPLGDIVHSAPIYYKQMVYIGANDGMLHGIRASTGEELFAYVPNLVYGHLSELASQAYSHKFYVDGTASVGAVGSRHVLVCGLGKGGKGYFALDVTDPTAMDASKVLWEYSADGASDTDMGYTFSRAFIINTAAGQVVIFGNGYDSDSGTAALYALDPITGAVLKKFDTQVGGCNGLATPAAVDVELDGLVDYVYAGDLKGNMWKFDLRDKNASQWTFGFKSGSSPQPLVTVKNSNGDLQPITSPVEVMLDCATTGDVRGLMVIFGTGQYLTTDDFVNVPKQSYYGIWDRAPIVEDASGLNASRSANLGTFEADRSLSNMSGATLLEQIFEVDQGEWWALTEYPADWYDAGPHMGWYWDMPVANERNINEPMLLEGHVVLISTVPSKSPCDSGGVSYVNIVNSCTGGRPYKPQFDVNLDQKITKTDTIVGPSSNKLFPSRHEDPKVFFSPLEVGDTMYLPDSEGGITGMPIVPIRAGMFFWRVIGQ